MDISAPVTDYIRGSILTTKGDLVKHNGVETARFPIGNAGQIIRVNSVPDNIEYANLAWLLFGNIFSGSNAADVTVLSTSTTIVSLDLGSVTSGSRLLCYWGVAMMKGATAGLNVFALEKLSGTADILCLHNQSSLEHNFNQDASVSRIRFFNGLFKVTNPGTLVLRIRGASAGSDGTVTVGSGQLYIIKII